ncbi:hypothetical protein RND71_001407 [Anisodus tanguticus]|uniref:PB1-like domain-containing protein n=1 Tax=Anisodus tanguticus TaxID=243964 RepID=A0AAE1T068_9SOLA|nr:hypothetical protein RND71_001407 [Anisodus tanguticus]
MTDNLRPTIAYGNACEDPDMYTIKLHFMNSWIFEPEMDYVGGRIDYYDYCKGDENSIIQMRQCMKKLNVDDRKVKFWFKFGPHFETSIRLLTNDSDIYNLVYKMHVNREVEIFVEHTNED